jgi:hypothetical protein
MFFTVFSFTSCKGDDVVEEPEVPKEPDIESTGWKVANVQNYEYTMTFMTQVAFDGVVSKNLNTEIGAFAGEECRGKANLVYESELKIYLCHLTIYGNEASGEQIKLIAYNPDTKKIYSNCTTLTFRSNTGEGSAAAVLNCLR